MVSNSESEHSVPRFMQEHYNPLNQPKPEKPKQSMEKQGETPDPNQGLPSIKPNPQKKKGKRGGHRAGPNPLSLSHKRAERKAIEKIKAKYVIDENGFLVSNARWKGDHPVQDTVTPSVKPKLLDVVSTRNLHSRPGFIDGGIWTKCGVCLAQLLERNLGRHFSKVHPGQPERTAEFKFIRR